MKPPAIVQLLTSIGMEIPEECPACQELNCFIKSERNEYLCHTCGTVLDSKKKIIGNIFNENYIATAKRHNKGL